MALGRYPLAALQAHQQFAARQQRVVGEHGYSRLDQDAHALLDFPVFGDQRRLFDQRGLRQFIDLAAELEGAEFDQCGQRFLPLAKLGDAPVDTDDIAAFDLGPRAVDLHEQTLAGHRVAVAIGLLRLQEHPAQAVDGIGDDHGLDCSQLAEHRAPQRGTLDAADQVGGCSAGAIDRRGVLAHRGRTAIAAETAKGEGDAQQQQTFATHWI